MKTTIIALIQLRVIKFKIMKNIFILSALTCFLLIGNQAKAQQDPQYTQYMYNMNVVNPAYAGSKEGVAGLLLFRRQWTQIEGTPNTEAFAIHAPIANDQF